MSLDSWSSSEGSREARSWRPRVIGWSGVSLLRRAGGWVSGCTDAKPVGEEVHPLRFFSCGRCGPFRPLEPRPRATRAPCGRARSAGRRSWTSAWLIAFEAIDSGSEIIALIAISVTNSLFSGSQSKLPGGTRQGAFATGFRTGGARYDAVREARFLPFLQPLRRPSSRSQWSGHALRFYASYLRFYKRLVKSLRATSADKNEGLPTPRATRPKPRLLLWCRRSSVGIRQRISTATRHDQHGTRLSRF